MAFKMENKDLAGEQEYKKINSLMIRMKKMDFTIQTSINKVAIFQQANEF